MVDRINAFGIEPGTYEFQGRTVVVYDIVERLVVLSKEKMKTRSTNLKTLLRFLFKEGATYEAVQIETVEPVVMFRDLTGVKNYMITLKDFKSKIQTREGIDPLFHQI